MDKSDAEIIQGFLEGRIKDYSLVLGWIREVVNRMVWGDRIGADDVTSDTTYKLLNNFKESKFHFDSSLKTYVQNIARYTSIDSFRSRKRAIEYATRAKLEELDADDPLEVFDSEHEFYLVDRILSLIDPRCIDLWKMIHLEGLTYKAISERTGLSEGAAKTRVSRCKDKALAIRRAVE